METEICGCDSIAAGGHGMNVKEQHEHAAIICCEHKAGWAGNTVHVQRPTHRRWPLQIESPQIYIRTMSPMTRGGGLGGGTGQNKSAPPAKIRPGVFTSAAAVNQFMIDGQEIIWQPFR